MDQNKLFTVADLLFPFLELREYAILEALAGIAIEYNWSSIIKAQRIPGALSATQPQQLYPFPAKLWASIMEKHANADKLPPKQNLKRLLKECAKRDSLFSDAIGSVASSMEEEPDAEIYDDYSDDSNDSFDSSYFFRSSRYRDPEDVSMITNPEWERWDRRRELIAKQWKRSCGLFLLSMQGVHDVAENLPRNARFKALKEALRARKLGYSKKSNSKICSDFVENGNGELAQVVDICEEFVFLTKHAGYRFHTDVLLKDGYDAKRQHDLLEKHTRIYALANPDKMAAMPIKCRARITDLIELHQKIKSFESQPEPQSLQLGDVSSEIKKFAETVAKSINLACQQDDSGSIVIKHASDSADEHRSKRLRTDNSAV